MANIAEIRVYDVANGPGTRVSVWFAGCDTGCRGCHNHVIRSFDSGWQMNLQDLKYIEESLRNPVIKGRLSILGGEPLHPKNIAAVKELIEYLSDRIDDLDIWLWTGYHYEVLMRNPDDIYQYILESCRVVVDGPFIQEELVRDQWRGSSNQRVIDVHSTIHLGYVEEVDGDFTL